MKTISKLFFSILFMGAGFAALAQWTGTGPVETSDLAIINRTSEAFRLNGTAPWMSFYASGVLNGWVFHDGTGMELMNNDAGQLRLGTDGIDRVNIETNGEVNITKTGIALRCAGAEALWSDGDNFSWGFGKDYSYWANEMVIGQSLIPSEFDGLTIGNNEDLRFEGTSAKYIRFTESGAQRGFMGHSGTNMIVQSDETSSIVEVDGQTGVQLRVNNSNALVINGSRNVGLGTSSPDKKLVVIGQGRIRNTGAGANYIYERTDRSAFAMGAGGQVGLNFDQNYNFELRSGLRVNVLDGQLTNGTSRLKVQGSNGYVGIGTFSPSSRLHVNGDITYCGTLINCSDRQLKQNITEFPLGLEEVKRLNPVTYQYNGDAGTCNSTTHVGMLAQELQKVSPDLVTEIKYEEEENGKILSTSSYLAIKESSIKYLLINSVKELAAENEELKNENQKLQENMTALETRMIEIEKLLANNQDISCDEKLNHEKDVALNGQSIVAELAQNRPNPFEERTNISYFLPEGTTGARMIIFSSVGKVLKTIPIEESGKGQINIQANSLPAGNYMYQLTTDTGVVGSKSMVLIK